MSEPRTKIWYVLYVWLRCNSLEHEGVALVEVAAVSACAEGYVLEVMDVGLASR